MNRLSYEATITESEQELLLLEKRQGAARFRDYVRFLRLLKSGACKTQGSAGAEIGLSERQSQRLWAQYRSKGLVGLLSREGRRGFGKLSAVEMSRLQQMLRTSQAPLTQEQVADWLEAQFGVRYDQSGVCRLFKRLRIKLKTGRPSNVRKNEAESEDFKKTSLA